jgi:hypothetical protein
MLPGAVPPGPVARAAAFAAQPCGFPFPPGAVLPGSVARAAAFAAPPCDFPFPPVASAVYPYGSILCTWPGGLCQVVPLLSRKIGIFCGEGSFQNVVFVFVNFLSASGQATAFLYCVMS